MRQLQKGPAPDVLTANEERWTVDYVEARNSDAKNPPEHWGDREIREELCAETAGKCAYCEALIGIVSYPHVEHIKPKSKFPELAHRWPNLTAACQRCNTNKGTYYDENLALLNPYVDNISAHLDFPGGWASFKIGAERGEFTISKIDLNHIDLWMARTKRLSAMDNLLERWNQAVGPKREMLAASIRLDAVNGEYTATVLQHLRHKRFPIDDPPPATKDADERQEPQDRSGSTATAV